MWSDDTFEDELRLAFSMIDEPEPGAGFTEGTVSRYRVRRRRRRLAAATPGVAAAAGLGLALGLGGPTSPRGPGSSGGVPSAPAPHRSEGSAVHVADYVFPLPAGFHLTAAATSTCHAVAVPATRPPAPTGPPHAARIYPANQYDSAQIATAANANGGCIQLAVTAAFTPTTATPNPYFAPTVTSSVHQITVNGDTAWLRAGALPAPAPVYLLTVAVPQADHQMQDLVVSSIGLSTHELLTIISQGLS